jgi:hypothetical protein
MITSLTITDLTRMSGNRVCIAGVTKDGRTIRPEFARGFITEDWLFEDGQVIVRPFAQVKLDLIENQPDPPHTEDWIVREDYKVQRRLLDQQEKLRLLNYVLDPDVSSIFGAEIHHGPGHFIYEGEGNRSIGTIHVRRVHGVRHNWNFERWNYRINFTDQSDTIYELSVTDLAFRYYLDHLRNHEGMSCEEISEQLSYYFQQGETFLRVGLARPTWPPHPHCCFLQINGVYTFPDYLDGRCFADFS